MKPCQHSHWAELTANAWLPSRLSDLFVRFNQYAQVDIEVQVPAKNFTVFGIVSQGGLTPFL
jgi:hypothetical protein